MVALIVFAGADHHAADDSGRDHDAARDRAGGDVLIAKIPERVFNRV